MNKQKQTAALLSKWGGVIDESYGAGMKANKKYFVAAVAQNAQFINENYEYLNVSNVNGIGPVAFPADPGTQAQFHDPARKRGSIDIAANVLALNMNLAAHTALFDLLPTIPIYSPLVQLDYVDYVYGGGKIASGRGPRYFQVLFDELYGATAQAAIQALKKGDEIYFGTAANGAAIAKATFVQTSRVKGSIIIRNEGVYDLDTTGGAGSYATTQSTKSLAQVAATADNIFTLTSGTLTPLITPITGVIFDLVSAGDEHIHGFAANDNLDGEPLSRSEAEQGTANVLELRTFSKAIEVKTYQTLGALTRRQIKDLRARGLESVGMLKNFMQNEITQSINDNGLKRMRMLGVTTHAQLVAAQGINLNLYLGAAGSASKAFSSFSVDPFVDKLGVNRTAEFGNIPNAESNSSAENQVTRQARVAMRTVAAAAILGNLSRFGAGDAAVVNTITLTAIKGQKNFTAALDNTLNQATQNMYYAGDLAGVKVYCNPKQRLNDNTILVLRTNKTADGVDQENINQGMVFLPYDLASTVEIVAEGTMSPKLLIESDFALSETGMYPELAYLTFGIHSDFGFI